ncbi:hypothetical protein ACPV5O_25730 [Vibrio maritimus]|uniref:hypothetical protein n=1 Tax=Vibrio maritimus TaxID=990268 RepID=UPI004068CF1C
MSLECGFKKSIAKRCEDNKVSFDDIRFKFQKVLDNKLNFVGMEILIDPQQLDERSTKQLYESAIFDKQFYLNQLSCINHFFLRGEFFSQMKSREGYLFVNVERSVLCDSDIMLLLSQLNKTVNRFAFKLVIEITERQICIGCNLVQLAFKEIKEKGIYIAADDYDYIQGDFRLAELMSGLYDFVKVDCPRDELELGLLKKLTKSRVRNKKIIIERVETLESLDYISEEEFFGCQGFLFDRGSLI